MAYLLDANVLIEAKNHYCGLDFCPAFWDWIIAKNAEEQVFSVKKIGNELEAGDNDLADWIGNLGDLVQTIPEVFVALGRVNDWALMQNYASVAVETFIECADCYLVAHALEGGHEVVMLKTLSGSQKRIKIPNVCIALSIECVTPFEMLRHMRPYFVLEATT